jgi:hypothetical protein
MCPGYVSSWPGHLFERPQPARHPASRALVGNNASSHDQRFTRLKRTRRYSMANGVNGLFLLPRRKKISRLTLSDAASRRSVETLVTQAYFQLVLVSWNESRSRATSLTKHGNYEVRLVELMSNDAADIPHLWVELYAKDVQTSIDACGCDDLEAAAMAADHFMSQAKQLEKGDGDARPGGGKANSKRPVSGM